MSRGLRAFALAGALLIVIPWTAMAAPPEPTQVRPVAHALSAMFRAGAAHTGVFSGPPAAGLAELWRFKTGGAVVGSPVVSGDTVYVGSGDDALYALAASTGALRWRAQMGGEVNSSPAIANGLVYVVSQDGALHAFDTATGAPRWKFATAGERRFTKPGVLGMSPPTEVMPDPWDFFLSSPTVADGVVFFGGGDGNVYAVDAGSGAERWAFKTGDVVHASPAVADGIVYVGSWDGAFYALDAASGRKLWSFATGDDQSQHLMTGIPGSAAVSGGRVFFGCRDANIYALDAHTGALIWKHPTDGSWVEASPAVLGDRVYVTTSDSEKFLALDAATGRTVFELPTHIYAFSSPALAGGHAYFGGFDGRLHDVDLTRRTYGASFATPGNAANGPRWLGDDGRLRMDLIWTGATLDAAIIGIRERIFSLGSILSSPSVQDGVVFVGSVDGNVYALH